MTLQHRAAFLAVLLIASAALHGQLGPERLLAPADRVPAAYSQHEPDIASNGRDFLAVWSDARFMGTSSQIRATRIDADGRLSHPLGFLIAASGRTVRVAPAGDDYVIAYESDAAYIVRFGSDAVIGSALNLGSVQLLDMATNGNTFCVIVRDRSTEEDAALIVGRDLLIVRKLAIPSRVAAVVAIGEQYVVASRVGAELVTTTISPDGVVASQFIGSGFLTQHLAMAAGRDRALIAWIADTDTRRTAVYMMVNASGARMIPVTPAHPPQQVQIFDGDDIPSVAWDGTRFLLGWRDLTPGAPAQRLVGVRIDTEGQLIDTAPFAITDRGRIPPRFDAATTGSTTMLISSEVMTRHADVVVRTMPSFNSVTTAEARPVTFSASAHDSPAVTMANGHAFAVWREVDSGAIAGARFNPYEVAVPEPLAIARGTGENTGPSIASGGDLLLVAWQEVTATRIRILARRLSTTGTFLDPSPILIAQTSHDRAPGTDSLSTSIAYDNNQQFFVAWRAADHVVRGARIARSGAVLDSQPLAFSPIAAPTKDLRAIWNGSVFVVIWAETTTSIIPHFPPVTSVRGARVTRDGVVLDAQQPRMIQDPQSGYDNAMAVTRGSERMMLVSRSSSSVRAIPIDLEGRPLAPAAQEIASESSRHKAVAVVWNGNTFFAFWQGGAGLMATRLGLDGRGLESAVVATDAFSPAAQDWTLVYAARAPEAEFGGVARIMARSLPFVGAPRRSRSVRH